MLLALEDRLGNQIASTDWQKTNVCPLHSQLQHPQYRAQFRATAYNPFWDNPKIGLDYVKNRGKVFSICDKIDV